MDVVGKQIEKLSSFVDDARQLMEGHSYTTPVQFNSDA
jgi:hypothetical protein